MEKKYITQNGIPIYTYSNIHLHSFTICLYLKAGSMYESDSLNGVSHFIEHIIFRNINKLRDGRLYQELDHKGLEFNGATYKEFVQFSISGSSKYFKDAVEIITQIYQPIILSSKEIDIERKRIKAEIRENDEKSTLDYFTTQIIWKNTSLANSIAGTFKNLDHIGKKILANMKEEVLAANNTFFYITGCFEEKEIFELREILEKYQVKVNFMCRDNVAPVPEGFFKRNGECIVKNSTYTYIRFSFDVDTSKYTDAELMLLSDILFDGDYCKIYQALSDKTGYIYSFSSCFEKYNNLGNLSLSYEVQPAYLYDAIQVTLEVFQNLKRGIYTELDYVKAPYIDNAGMLLDSAEDLNWTMAYENHVLNQGYESLEDRIEVFGKVEGQQLTTMAREIFKKENLLITLKGNKKKIDVQKINQISKKI